MTAATPPTLAETLDELEELMTEVFDQLDGYLTEEEQGASAMAFARCSMLIRRVRNAV